MFDFALLLRNSAGLFTFFRSDISVRWAACSCSQPTEQLFTAHGPDVHRPANRHLIPRKVKKEPANKKISTLDGKIKAMDTIAQLILHNNEKIEQLNLLAKNDDQLQTTETKEMKEELIEENQQLIALLSLDEEEDPELDYLLKIHTRNT